MIPTIKEKIVIRGDGYLYAIWSDLTIDQIRSIPGIEQIVPGIGDSFNVWLNPRYIEEEVLAAIRELAEAQP